MNAFTGCGSECLKNYQDQKPKIYSGGLHKLDETAKGGAGSTAQDNDKNKKPDLNDYFESMQSKDNPTILNSKLQKRMDENRKRRSKMKSQFGQFSSYSAL